MLIEARLERVPAIIVAGERRDCHRAHARRMPFALTFANAGQQLIAILAGKSDIADHHIRTVQRQRLSCRGRRGRDAHARSGRLEELPHRLRRCRFILDDEHLHPRELRVPAGRGVAVRNRQFLSSRERQSHGKGRAASLPLAVRADRAAVQLHQLPGDGQSQAQPRMLSAGHRFSLLEAIEHQRQEVGTNTYAVVANDDLHGAAVPGQLDLDGSARRGELHGIAQQIQDHLLNPIRIGAHHAHFVTEPRFQPDAAGGRIGQHGVNRALHDLCKPGLAQRQTQLP